MKDSTVKKYKLNIDGEDYNFSLDMEAALKCEDKYGSFAEIFNGLLVGEKYYNNALKMLSCACVEKEWDYIELAKEFSINHLMLKRIDEIVHNMYTEFEAFEDNKSGSEEGKNKEASQSTK